MLCYAKSLQSCPTLCNPIDGNALGSAIPGILQARTLEWVAISFSNAWKWKVKVKLLSRVQLLATQWTAAHQAPLSKGFSRQEYWSGVSLFEARDQSPYTHHQWFPYHLIVFSCLCVLPLTVSYRNNWTVPLGPAPICGFSSYTMVPEANSFCIQDRLSCPLVISPPNSRDITAHVSTYVSRNCLLLLYVSGKLLAPGCHELGQNWWKRWSN